MRRQRSIRGVTPQHAPSRPNNRHARGHILDKMFRPLRMRSVLPDPATPPVAKQIAPDQVCARPHSTSASGQQLGGYRVIDLHHRYPQQGWGKSLQSSNKSYRCCASMSPLDETTTSMHYKGQPTGRFLPDPAVQGHDFAPFRTVHAPALRGHSPYLAMDKRLAAISLAHHHRNANSTSC